MSKEKVKIDYKIIYNKLRKLLKEEETTLKKKIIQNKREEALIRAFENQNYLFYCNWILDIMLLLKETGETE